MSAGLPGLGLGGLFFIFSALLAPVPELGRTLRGRSGLAAWRVIGRQFAQAAAMIAAIDLTIRLAYVGLSITGLGDVPPADTGTVLPLTLIGITSALLVAVVGTAKLAGLAVRIRTAELPRTRLGFGRPRDRIPAGCLAPSPPQSERHPVAVRSAACREGDLYVHLHPAPLVETAPGFALRSDRNPDGFGPEHR